VSDIGGVQTWEALDAQGRVIGGGTTLTTPPVDDQLSDRVRQGYAGLRAYVALPTPTAAQTAQAVQLLCRVVIALMRSKLGDLDGVD
jgi:hypothetical protein